MSARYDLPIVENCLVCKLRKDNFFCALPRAALETLERIKIATLLPKNTPIFAEGGVLGAFTSCAKARSSYR